MLLEGRDIRPVIPLRQTPAVKAGKHPVRSCEHGTWVFAGADAKRGASKWRCPSGACKPCSAWIGYDGFVWPHRGGFIWLHPAIG
jgi:hypothetical protein